MPSSLNHFSLLLKGVMSFLPSPFTHIEVKICVYLYTNKFNKDLIFSIFFIPFDGRNAKWILKVKWILRKVR